MVVIGWFCFICGGLSVWRRINVGIVNVGVFLLCRNCVNESTNHTKTEINGMFGFAF